MTDALKFLILYFPNGCCCWWITITTLAQLQIIKRLNVYKTVTFHSNRAIDSTQPKLRLSGLSVLWKFRWPSGYGRGLPIVMRVGAVGSNPTTDTLMFLIFSKCGPIQLFLVPASVPQLVHQSPWYGLYCLVNGAYKTSFGANGKEGPHELVAADFPSGQLSSP